MKRSIPGRVSTIAFIALVMLATLVLGACTDLPGSEDLPTPTPVPTATPEPVPTSTPTPSPSPTPTYAPRFPRATPTPVIGTLSDGWYNSMATWSSEGVLVRTAAVEQGAIIYANNFERDLGNRVSPLNTCNNAEIFTTDRIAGSGYYSVKVSRRKQEYHGLSGFGFQLSINNGLTYNRLVGEMLCLRCKIYYEDEGFGAPTSILFTAYDTFHTEMALDYVYNRKDGSRTLDKNGNPVMKEQERFVRYNSVRVNRGTWTECTFYVPVLPSDVANGCILIGTTDELPNSVGLYCSYYIDDLTVSVLSRDEYPIELSYLLPEKTDEEPDDTDGGSDE
jgi:Predicted solute binding protein